MREALSDIVLRIGEWQSEAAFLEAKASSQRTAPRRAAELREEVLSLRKEAEAAIAGLPEGLRRHGRVLDMLKAVDTLTSRLDGVCAKPRSMS